MTPRTASAAFIAGATEIADQVEELRAVLAGYASTDPDSVTWADVGTLQADIAHLRELTDRHNHRGEYAHTF